MSPTPEPTQAQMMFVVPVERDTKSLGLYIAYLAHDTPEEKWATYAHTDTLTHTHIEAVCVGGDGDGSDQTKICICAV